LTLAGGSGDTGCTDADCCGCESSALKGGPSGVEFGDHRLDSVQWAVRAAAFRLLLDEGQPAAMTSIAEAAGVGVTTTLEVLEGFAKTGNVSFAGDQVVGIAGLSVEPTQHRIDLAAGRRWTWCALDAVGIVGAIGDGVIHSEMAQCPVQVHVKDGEVESTNLAVFVADGYGMTSAVDQWCPLVNFFATLESATAWAEEFGVAGRSIPVTTIAPQLIERWRLVLNHHQPD